MKKIITLLVMLAMIPLLSGLFGAPVHAAQQEAVTVIKMVTAREAVDAMTQPSDTSEVFHSFEAGSSLLVVEETDPDWYCITYKGELAYVRKTATQEETKFAEEMEQVEEEFSQISQESTLLAETLEKNEKDTKRTVLWGGLIGLLIIGIIVVGVMGKKQGKGQKEKRR